MIKDTDEQPDEERRVSGKGGGFPCTLRVSPRVHQPGSSPKPVLLGFGDFYGGFITWA